MGLFQFNNEELLTFFAVLVRFATLFALLPIVGDRFVPAPVKVLLALTVTFMLFPILVKEGTIHPGDAMGWAATTGGIVKTVIAEMFVGLVLGFTAKLLFDAIHFGSNLVGNFMGFGMASTYDPHQETQTHVVAEIQMAVATLGFLALDGHHLILTTAMDSYSWVGLGQAGVHGVMQMRLLEMTSQVILFGLQLAAPMALVLFAVNVAFGVFSKALPQLNVLVLSMGISAFVGLMVMFITEPEFQTAASSMLSRTDTWMHSMLLGMTGR